VDEDEYNEYNTHFIINALTSVCPPLTAESLQYNQEDNPDPCSLFPPAPSDPGSLYVLICIHC